MICGKIGAGKIPAPISGSPRLGSRPYQETANRAFVFSPSSSVSRVNGGAMAIIIIN
jgi:hypothetical protein